METGASGRLDLSVAGIYVSSYNRNWNRLFKRSLQTLHEFKSFFLMTDRDTSILDGLKGKLQPLSHRCFWHIPHQLNFTMWQG